MTRTSTPKPTPETTIEWMRQARKHLDRADRNWAADDPEGAGDRLHKTAEIAVKTLTMANNRRHSPIHDICKLWTEAEAVNGQIEVDGPDGRQASAQTLAALTRYGGGEGYNWPTREESQRHFTELRGTVGRLVEYMERRAPEVLGARKRKREGAKQKAPDDEAPAQPSTLEAAAKRSTSKIRGFGPSKQPDRNNR